MHTVESGVHSNPTVQFYGGLHDVQNPYYKNDVEQLLYASDYIFYRG